MAGEWGTCLRWRGGGEILFDPRNLWDQVEKRDGRRAGLRCFSCVVSALKERGLTFSPFSLCSQALVLFVLVSLKGAPADLSAMTALSAIKVLT